MGEYEARNWRAWQHPMALVGLAMLFVTEERLDHRPEAPLLSTRDVVELIDWYFKSPRTEEEVEAALRQRHRLRAKMGAHALARATRAVKQPASKLTPFIHQQDHSLSYLVARLATLPPGHPFCRNLGRYEKWETAKLGASFG